MCYKPPTRSHHCAGMSLLQILKADLGTSSDVGKGDFAAIAPPGQSSQRQNILVAIDQVGPVDAGTPGPVRR